MEERSDLPHMYIAVDPSKLMRCDWCGTLESENWIRYENGVYCSATCKSAVDSIVTPGLVLLCVVPIFLVAVITAITSSIEGMAFLLVMLFAGIFCLCFYLEGKKSAALVPQSSRRTEIQDDISLLKAIMTHIECPNCDGNIDIDEIGKDQIYHCGYCGASGVVEITFTDK